MATLLKVREIKSLNYKSDEFDSMYLYFPSINSRNHPIYAYIYRKLYLVKGLKANLLLGNDILAIEKVIINLASKTTVISSCQIMISISAWPRS